MSINHYENFPVASILLPRHLRPAVQALYRYARAADDLADEGDASTAQRLEALTRFRSALQGVPNASWPLDLDPIFAPLATAVRAHNLPMSPLLRLLDAFEQDVKQPRHENRDSLMAYSKNSANPVGELILHLHGVASSQTLHWSDAICTGLQLVNFWQDLGIDVSRHRHYLPEQELQGLGWSQDRLTQELPLIQKTGQSPPELRALVADLCHWADGLLIEGSPLALTIPGRVGWELRLVVLGGRRILEKIRAMDYNTLITRPKLGRGDWPRLLWRAARMTAPILQ